MCNFKQVSLSRFFTKFVIKTDFHVENLLRTLTSNTLVANLSEMLFTQRNLKVSRLFFLA